MAQTVINKRIAALRYDYAARATVRPPVCNLCGARNRAVKVAERDRYGYPARLVQCRRCGLAYLCPQLDATQYEHFYSKVYRPLVSAYHGRRIDAHTVQHDQRAYAAELAPFLFPLLPSPPRTILDVGGSTGVVAKALADRLNATVTVLDPAPDELAVARAAGMETIAGFVEDFDPERRRWDLVLLCQTIDHLLDVRGALTALRQMTAPDGRVFVDIVDVEVLLRRTGDIERAVKIDHPYYFTGPTAAALFDLTGFTIIAQRLSDDGHRGFVLAPGSCTEPDWVGLEIAAAQFLASVRSTRAAEGGR
ncbi:MAG TPA: class I SAM-dependent methyltransferase [Pseudonocardiaceae bacterium]|nr:class I SAM-dependent methyltransferase [Pseudonocardiaceae bacterium]